MIETSSETSRPVARFNRRPKMQKGSIVTSGQKIAVRFTRKSPGGRVWPLVAGDFIKLLRLFDAEDGVMLRSDSGDWKSKVRIEWPETLKPESGSFRFLVQTVSRRRATPHSELPHPEAARGID